MVEAGRAEQLLLVDWQPQQCGRGGSKRRQREAAATRERRRTATGTWIQRAAARRNAHWRRRCAVGTPRESRCVSAPVTAVCSTSTVATRPSSRRSAVKPHTRMPPARGVAARAHSAARRTTEHEEKVQRKLHRLLTVRALRFRPALARCGIERVSAQRRCAAPPLHCGVVVICETCAADQQVAQAGVGAHGGQQAVAHEAGGHGVAANVQRAEAGVARQRIAQRAQTGRVQVAVRQAERLQRRVGGEHRSKCSGHGSGLGVTPARATG